MCNCLSCKQWDNSVIAYVVGSTPFYAHIKAFAARIWRPKGNIEVFSRENVFFLFRFDVKEYCDAVLQGNPWLFAGRLVIVRKWEPSANLEGSINQDPYLGETAQS